MLQELSSYMYVWVLICTEDAYHANSRRAGRREKVALQIQEVAPTMCVVWHFAPCGTLL